MMQKWEYKIIDANDERNSLNAEVGNYDTMEVIAALNRLGKEGWELLSVRYDENGMIHRAIFKRVIAVEYDLQGVPL